MKKIDKIDIIEKIDKNWQTNWHEYKTLPQILIHMESFMKAMNNKIGVIKNKKLSIIYKFYNIINCKV